MINVRMLCRIMGFLTFVETGMLLCCIAVSAYYREDDLRSFIFSFFITLSVSLSLWLIGRKAKMDFSRRDGIIIVSTSWIVVSFLGMFPFLISDYIPDVTNAFFETISGFTSTGSTILDDIEILPHGLLFWRSMTQWIGGLGIVFFTIAILPIFGIGGLQLFAEEASGFKYDKVHPRIQVTAKWIWSVYLGLTSIIAVLLWIGGMDTFDSICHSFTTAGTGGFSTKQESIGYYHSPFIEYVISVSMIISGINFMLLLLFTKGKFKKFFRNTELKFYLTSLVFFTILITFGLYNSSSMSHEESFRKAFFQVASLHTSTGYYTEDYMLWQPALWGLLIILMLIGACAGSTSGGIKCIRIVILNKVVINEFKKLIHPNAVLPVRLNKHVAPQGIITSVLSFIYVYLVIIVLGVLIMMSLGMEFYESVGTVISSISNMGPGLGQTGPAYSWNSLPDAAKWLSSFLMLTGRLELFTVLILFTRIFWKKN